MYQAGEEGLEYLLKEGADTEREGDPVLKMEIVGSGEGDGGND